MSDAPTIQAARSMLTFRVGATLLAVAASDVAEVLRPPRITRVPHAPESLHGVASLRGVIAPVVSVAKLLGKDGDHGGAQSRVILLSLDSPIGLLVDEVIGLSNRQLDAVGSGQLFVEGDDAVRVVDLPGLLRRVFSELTRARRAEPALARSATADVETRRNETALMSFELAGQSYALDLEHVLEVIAMPAALSAMPDGDVADLGVATLRDDLLPVVSARRLLGLPPQDAAGHRRSKVVVTRIGSSVLGLAVDDMSAIVRVANDAIGPVPAVLNRGGGEGRIEAIGRLADGRSMIAILSPERLFRDESLAQILADGRRDTHMTAHAEDAARQTFVVFRLGDEEYGLPIASVDEVAHLPATLTRVPRAPAFIEGVMNLRGKIVPVIDQTKRFSSPTTDQGQRRVVVTRLGDVQAGFIVDGVSEILHLSPDQLSPAPGIATEEAQVFDGVANMGDGRIILLVDPKALLDRAEADLLTAFESQQES